MKFKGLILMLFVLFLSMSMISANEIEDNITSVCDETPIEMGDKISSVSELKV